MQHDIKTSRSEAVFSPRWWNDTNDLIASIEDDLRGRDRAMAIEIPFNDDFSEQMDRTGSHGRSPCIVCGRQCPNPRYMVHVHEGLLTIVTEEEATRLNEDDPSGDMGMWPIGTDCLKKHPELRPYVQEQMVIKPSEWQKLYFDLYRQTCGNELADEQEVMADAYKRIEILRHSK